VHGPRVAKALPGQLFPGQAGEQVRHVAPFGRDHLMDQHALFSDARRCQRALPLAGFRVCSTGVPAHLRGPAPARRPCGNSVVLAGPLVCMQSAARLCRLAMSSFLYMSEAQAISASSWERTDQVLAAAADPDDGQQGEHVGQGHHDQCAPVSAGSVCTCRGDGEQSSRPTKGLAPPARLHRHGELTGLQPEPARAETAGGAAWTVAARCGSRSVTSLS
jgi:hypothetical protein